MKIFIRRIIYRIVCSVPPNTDRNVLKPAVAESEGWVFLSVAVYGNLKWTELRRRVLHNV